MKISLSSVLFHCPEEINIDSIDLGIIISNAIANAINACVKIEDGQSSFYFD